MSRRSTRRRPRSIFTNIQELNGVYSTTRYLVYKCDNPDEIHEYRAVDIPTLMKTIEKKFLSIFENADPNRIRFSREFMTKFPYIGILGRLRDDLVGSKMCLICIRKHLESKKDELKNCYFNEEAK